MNQDLKQLQIELAQALQGLTRTQTQSTPTTHPEKWSIQQIVQHLILSYESTQSFLQQHLITGVPTRIKLTLTHRFGQVLVLNLGYLPNGREAPAMVVPSAADAPLPGDEILIKATAALFEMDTLLEQNRLLFGSKRFATHFVLGPLSANQWARFHLIHGRHHTRQIHAIRKQQRVGPRRA